MIPGSAALLSEQRRTRKNTEPRLAFRMVHVAVISNSRLWREALCSLLDQPEDGLHVLAWGEFHHILELMAKEPDVAVLDAGHSMNRDLVRRTLATLSGRLAVVAGTGEKPEEILHWFEAGASGYVSWNSSREHLVRALLETAKEQLHCPPEIAVELLKRVQRTKKFLRPDSRVSLTPREREIEDLLPLFPTKEIADMLHIEVSTVKNHLHQIYKKRHVHGRLEAIRAMATERGAVTPEDLDRSN